MENDFGGAAMQEQKQKQKQKQEEKQPRYFTRPALRGGSSEFLCSLTLSGASS